jgi:hypothetical protein
MVLAALLLAPGAGAQGNKKKGQETTRTVQGTVTGPDDAAVEGAVVQLKNLKTLQIRSFITQKGGMYHFNELSADVDYELHADQGAASSSTKTLSSFDSRKEAIINLKLNNNKK